MPQDDLASEWKSFDEAKRTRLLSKMTPEQKKILRSKLEGSSATPAAATVEQTPGAIKRFAQSAYQGAGGMTSEQGKKFFTDPIGTAKGLLEAQGALGAQAGRELKSGDYVRGLAHGIEYLIPGLGPTMAHSGEQLESGDIAGGTGTLLGAGATLLLDPETAAKVPERIAAKAGEVRRSVQPFARKVTEVEGALKSEATKAAEKHGEAVAEHKVAHRAAIEDNLRTQAEAKSKIEQSKVIAKGRETAISEATKKLDEQSHALKGHLEKVEASVKAEADAKFDKVREKLGVTEENPGPSVNPDTLVATVKHAQESTLQNIPESIKEFKAILQHEGIPESMVQAVREHAGFEPEGAEPLTWSKLQSVKSRLDARLRSRTPMNGDVRRALFEVRDGVVNDMGSLAEQHGAAPEWADAKQAWTQYKQDFHEATGPSGSGSPIARALQAKDPANIRQPFVGNASARAIETLNKYPQHGGAEAAKAATELISGHEQLGKLPTPGKISEVHPLPARKPMPKPPEAPIIDAQKVARQALAKKAANWANVNARDIGILSSGYLGGFLEHIFRGGGFELPFAVTAYEGGKFMAGRALNKPAVIEWLSKTPQNELDVIAKIPGTDKVKIVNALTDAAVQTKATNLSQGVRNLLGPANVMRIMAQSSQRKEKKPGEQLRDLRRIQNAHSANPNMPAGPGQ